MLVLRGSRQFLFSKEGCTQESGCAMQAYAIGILPLIQKLKNPSKWIQNWYADDGSCLGKLKYLIEWLELLSFEGPKHGYNNEASKMILIVAPQFVEQAKIDFQEFGVEVLTGHRILGGFVGSQEDKSDWLKKKTNTWVHSVMKLSYVAKKDPHAAFVALSKSLQNEWSFIQRVVQGDDDSFLSLKETICQKFLPEICGFDITDFDSDLMLRPSRFGGTGIRDPIKAAASAYKTSFEASTVLKDAIMLDTPFDLHSHAQHYHKVVVNSKEAEDQKHLDEVKVLVQNLLPERKLYKDHLSRIVSNKCSAWLSVNPWEDEYFFMPPDEFRDSMSCRYGKTPKGLQAWCDECGEAFDANHALDCKNGGLVHQRHNEMRNENCDLNKKAGLSQVLCEPVIREADQNGVGGLKGDWSV